MTRHEAQFILTAYRPGGEDAASEVFQEALQMAEVDPELRRWFADEQAMDRFVSAKLGRIVPPADLRERILMGGRVSRRPARSLAVRWLAWAASLLLFAVVATNFLRPHQPPDLGSFAVSYANAGFDLEKEGADFKQLEAWLKDRKMPTPANVPINLASLEKLGCRTANFNGTKVSIICFQGDREYHLFVSSKGLLDRALDRKTATSGKWSVVSWSDSKNDYALVSDAGPASIQRLL